MFRACLAESTPVLHKYQGMPSAYVRRFYHRGIREHSPAFGRNKKKTRAHSFHSFKPQRSQSTLFLCGFARVHKPLQLKRVTPSPVTLSGKHFKFLRPCNTKKLSPQLSSFFLCGLGALCGASLTSPKVRPTTSTVMGAIQAKRRDLLRSFVTVHSIHAG